MLKRIKFIKGIGRFSDAGHQELAKITLIYGLNGYGKSTLSDIFRSLHQGNADIIDKRKTINRGASAEQQPEAAFAFSVDGNTNEVVASYADGQWEKSALNYEFEIFDSRFIEDNVFTGLYISRPNRENLTNLILGEENVELAKQVRDLKQEQTKLSQEHNDLSESLKRSLGVLNFGITLEEFVALSKPTNIEKVKESVNVLTKEKLQLENTLSKVNEIDALSKPTKINYSENLLSEIDEFCSLLQKGFSDLDQEALSNLKKHIKKYFKTHDGEEEGWLRHGVLQYVIDDDAFQSEHAKCPFCGQPLSDVLDLITTYRTFFGDAYQKYYNSLEQEMDAQLRKLEEGVGVLETIAHHAKNNQLLFHKYAEYSTKEERQLLAETEGWVDQLEKTASDLINEVKACFNKLGKAKETKLKKPFEPIQLVKANTDSIKEKYIKLLAHCADYDNGIGSLLEGIEKLKEKTKNKKFEDDLRGITDALRKSEILQKRYEFSPDVERWNEIKDKRNRVDQSIEQLQNQLEAQNQEFVQNYFSDVSNIFNSFGANEFQIQDRYSRRGLQPVYGFTIKFRDQEITDDSIPYIFSDADRRALAFSIFLAKLKSKSESQERLNNTVVLLDDPVISFDENRTSQTILKVKELINQARQIIILSHYRDFLKKVYENLDGTDGLLFLEIIRDRNGSSLKEIENPSIRFDPYAQVLEEMERFIEGENLDPDKIRKGLRTVLQKELEWRFRRQLKNASYDGLGNLVTHLQDNNVVSSQIAAEAQRLNNLIRIDHHGVDHSSPEDTRNLVREVLEFIFNKLNP